jgi:DNA-binding beta-propeller fold protein YncE
LQSPVGRCGIAETRFQLRIALVSALVAVGVLSLAPRASAERTFETQMSGFSGPYGLAVDGGDNVWVDDYGAGGHLFKYDPFPSQTEIGSQDGGGHFGSYILSIAVNNSTGYLYVADSGPVVVDIFDGSGVFSERWNTINSCGLDYVAVDNSGSASQGRVYVARSCDGLKAYNPDHSAANFTESASYINGNAITGTPNGGFGGVQWVATDANGHFYAVDQGNNEVDEFAPSGAFVQALKGEGAPGGFTAPLTGVAVDPTNDDILVVDRGSNVIDEFDASGAFVEQIVGTGPAQSTPFTQLSGGIAVNSSGYVYVADKSQVDIFSPNAILPKVTYGAVTNKTQTSGTVNATVDLNGGPNVTSCTIQYGTDTTYGSSIPCTPSTPYSGTTSISANLTGLTTEGVYHYRVVLVTANGTKKATDQVYVPHAVAGLTTEPATEVERNSATLNGSYTGNGEDTHYLFEWGTTPLYGNKTAVPPGADKGTGSGPQSLTFPLTGLTVETTYHYRVVATNSKGTSYGEDQSFKTLAAVEELTTEPASEVTATSATLNASYTGIGENVHYFFEWGLTASYGSTTAGDDRSGSGPQNLSFPISNLSVNTSYHYRVVASDASGTTFGADQNFRTLGRYQFASSFGTAGAGDGQLNHPQDVAVDNATGDVYVADTGNHRVVKFDSSGNFLEAWGWGVDDGSAIAQVCTSGCQAGIAGGGLGQFTTPKFIEVDNSSGPSSGDVYVADVNDSVVQKFDPSGNLVSGWENGGGVDRSHDGSIGGITVSSVGNLYVLGDNLPYLWTEISEDGTSQKQYVTGYNEELVGELGTPAETGIEISDSGNFYETQPPGGGGVRYSSPDATIYSGSRLYGPEAADTANSGLTLDRTTNDIYVDQGGHIDQFSAATGCPPQGCNPSDTFGTSHLSGAAGLAFDPGPGLLYAANTGGSNIAVFAPLPTPDAETGPTTNVDITQGTLTGHVDPGPGGQISDCYFQYGTDSTYGLGTIPCSPAPPISSPTEVSAPLAGLAPFGVYHYRLVAIRSDGKGFPTYGRDRSFTAAPPSPPVVDETSFSEVTPTSVTLSARINPQFAPTIFRFQYGTDTGYGSQTLAGESIGEDGVDHPVSSTINGLAPGTTYHFRVIATNVNGPTPGQDQTFTTPARPTIFESSASGLGQTTATLNASVIPGFRPTSLHFEYGLTRSYGSSTAESPLPGPTDSLLTSSATIAALTPGTLYHFRAVATNEIGVTQGLDGIFTTRGATEEIVTPPPPPATKCKAGFVRKHGKCVKKHHHRRKHKRRSHR